MIVEEVLKNIAVQGSLLDLDTEVYASIIRNRQNGAGGNDDLSQYITRVLDFCDEGSLDPWAIDVSSLVSLFRRLEGDEIDNFSMAGHFVVQAWHILFEKSQRAIDDNTVQDEMIEDSMQDDFSSDETREFRPAIIKQRITHYENRNLMLVEVLEAVRLSLRAARRKRTVKVPAGRQDYMEIEDVIQELNAEEPEKEILEAMRKILEYAGIEIPLEEIWGTSKEEKGPFFSYCLFLAKEGYIGLKQEKPFSSITIRKNEEAVPELVSDAGRNKRQ